MTDNRILFLASNFRKKIEQAQRKGLFINTSLAKFPFQCCGNASTLLAEFLMQSGVESLWISSENPDTYETHAWLVVKDNRVKFPHHCFDDVSDNIKNLLNKYAGESSLNRSEPTRYDKQDIENGLIIDITGDQFNEPPVYVGYMNGFYKQFDFLAAYEHESLLDGELIKLYNIILSQNSINKIDLA